MPKFGGIITITWGHVARNLKTRNQFLGSRDRKNQMVVSNLKYGSPENRLVIPNWMRWSWNLGSRRKGYNFRDNTRLWELISTRNVFNIKIVNFGIEEKIFTQRKQLDFTILELGMQRDPFIFETAKP